MISNYTIGVEEEYMLCDNAGDLANKANFLMKNLPKNLLDRYSYELILSEFESNTSVHDNVSDCLSEISMLRNTINKIAKKNNFKIGISGTHPTARTDEQEFVINDSYNWVSDQLKYYATKNITFSIHVHIGLNDKDKLVSVTNTLRRWIPPLLALSTNSPFFEGQNTGMLSSRTFQFGLFPRTEIPSFLNSYKDYEEIINKYIETKTISKPRQIWWKIRPHYDYKTIEVVSAGDRDPDAEGVTGMSASKMRAAATNGDKDAFLTGLPSGFRDGEKLYRDVRKYMGIREERDMGDMTDFEPVRDMYLTGKIWNAGDIVEAKGITGEFVRKGTNYLSFVDEDG